MIFDKILGWFSKDLGIDLGTANTLVCLEGRGIVLAEPSMVAVRRGTNEVLLNGNAVGTLAKEMWARGNRKVEAIRPLRDGVIADFEITEAMLNYFIRRVHNRRWGVRPRVVIAVPSGINMVEKRAVYNSAERAGARQVFLIEEPRAAGIGAGLPVEEPVANMVVDIGGGTTEVAVLSLADIVTSQSIKIAGDDMDDAVTAHMRRAHNMHVGAPTAERVKIAVGSAYPLEQELEMPVKGTDVMSGMPKQVLVSSEEIRECLRESLEAILQAIRATLESTPPELASDLVDRGMVLCGGGALLRGLDRLIMEETGLPTVVADDPLTCVAVGTGMFLQNLDRYTSILEAEDGMD